MTGLVIRWRWVAAVVLAGMLLGFAVGEVAGRTLPPGPAVFVSVVGPALIGVALALVTRPLWLGEVRR